MDDCSCAENTGDFDGGHRRLPGQSSDCCCFRYNLSLIPDAITYHQRVQNNYSNHYLYRSSPRSRVSKMPKRRRKEAYFLSSRFHCFISIINSTLLSLILLLLASVLPIISSEFTTNNLMSQHNKNSGQCKYLLSRLL